MTAHLAHNLTHALQYHQALKTHRTIQVVEDLLNNCEGVMSRAMHQEQFVDALVRVASVSIQLLSPA